MIAADPRSKPRCSSRHSRPRRRRLITSSKTTPARSSPLDRRAGHALLAHIPDHLAAIAAEAALGRFYHGKWPHLASAYISGISAGILIKSPELWPFVLVRPDLDHVEVRAAHRRSAPVEPDELRHDDDAAAGARRGQPERAGRQHRWAVLVIWILGGGIMYRLGRFHIPLAFMAAFMPLVLCGAG